MQCWSLCWPSDPLYYFLIHNLRGLEWRLNQVPIHLRLPAGITTGESLMDLTDCRQTGQYDSQILKDFQKTSHTWCIFYAAMGKQKKLKNRCVFRFSNNTGCFFLNVSWSRSVLCVSPSLWAPGKPSTPGY